MFLRGQHVSAVRLVVDIICCLCGLGILAYAIYLWSGYGFSLGPRYLHPGAPDPSAHARWLVFVGLAVAGYFGFSLFSTFTQTDSRDEGDETKNI